MSWPPTIGKPLPRAGDAFGVDEKLSAYCLNPDHELGGAKAKGFLQILGIASADVEHLTAELLAGVTEAPITSVRDNAPFGVLCEVRIGVRGLREHHDRVVEVTTSWELRDEGDPPRLVTAYIDG
jgi:hypothetical protein